MIMSGDVNQARPYTEINNSLCQLYRDGVTTHERSKLDFHS